jgi:hypothetical protein
LLIPSFEIEREAHEAPPDVEASILGVESEPWLLDGVDFRGNTVEKSCEREIFYLDFKLWIAWVCPIELHLKVMKKIFEQNGSVKNLLLCPVSRYWLFAFFFPSLLHRHNKAEC